MIKNNKINYLKLAGKNKVVILGETSHSNFSFQNEIVIALKNLKLAGFTHIGMEMLPTNININDVNLLQKHAQEYYYKGHAFIVKQAIQLNLKIVPLDMPYDQQSNYKNPEKLYKDRNLWMTTAAHKILKQGHKIILIMHYGHSINGTPTHDIPNRNGIQSMLKNLGVSSTNIKLVGGLWGDKKGINCISHGRLPVSIQAQKNGLQNMLFSVKGSLGVDFTVHVPQECIVR